VPIDLLQPFMPKTVIEEPKE
jgi:hypothetical protein